MCANTQFLWIFSFTASELCEKTGTLLVKISEKPLWAGHFEIFFAKVNFGSETDYMKASELVIDNEAFTDLRGECEKIIDTHKRLPDLVFRRSFAKYFAIEYGHIYGNEFGAFLFAISGIFGDESVHFMTIDPPPESYYSQCSFFGAASFERSRLVKRYVPVLSRERNVPKLLAGVNVGVLWGSSLKWGIFCDRLSGEMAVIAVLGDIDVPTISGFRCMDPSGVSSYMNSQYHWKPSAASDFTQRFLANYPI